MKKNTNLQFEIREVASWASESGEAYPNMSDGEVLDEVIQRLEILANLKAKSEAPNLRAFDEDDFQHWETPANASAEFLRKMVAWMNRRPETLNDGKTIDQLIMEYENREQ